MSVRHLVGGTMAAVIAAVVNPAVAVDTYALDPAHSQPMFEVQHMSFSLQRGTFSGATGTIILDRAARKGSIDVSIDTSTVRTSDPRLDTHVRAEDFFNVAKYPSMSFKSSALEFDGERVVGAEGTLTLLGITKPVKLKVANFVCGFHPYTRTRCAGLK